MPLLRRGRELACLRVVVDVRLVYVEVLRLADECADRLAAVPPRPPEMVEQLLEELGRSDLDDASDALVVDAHTEGLIRHDHVDAPLDKLQLRPLPLGELAFLVADLALPPVTRAKAAPVAFLQLLTPMVASHANRLGGWRTVLRGGEQRLQLRADVLHLGK